MSKNHRTDSLGLTKPIKKKAKNDLEQRRTMNPSTLEPRRDLPIHKIPELLAKITGTFSSESKSAYSSHDYREHLFEHYSSNHQLISLDGILRFCTDLSIEPDSYEVLLFCFLCRAKQMYSLTKDEFLLGLRTLGNHVENLVDLRTALFKFDISPYEKEFYLWTYHFGLIDSQRCLTTANAISLWRLFYSKTFDKPSILDSWVNYLEIEDMPKTITCDTWTIFPLFAKFIQMKGYESYDDNEAWPCLFDGFVEFQQKTRTC